MVETLLFQNPFNICAKQAQQMAQHVMLSNNIKGTITFMPKTPPTLFTFTRAKSNQKNFFK